MIPQVTVFYHIRDIRKKIGDNGNKAILLKTVYGVGYSLSM